MMNRKVNDNWREENDRKWAELWERERQHALGLFELPKDAIADINCPKCGEKIVMTDLRKYTCEHCGKNVRPCELCGKYGAKEPGTSCVRECVIKKNYKSL